MPRYSENVQNLAHSKMLSNVDRHLEGLWYSKLGIPKGHDVSSKFSEKIYRFGYDLCQEPYLHLDD